MRSSQPFDEKFSREFFIKTPFCVCPQKWIFHKHLCFNALRKTADFAQNRTKIKFGGKETILRGAKMSVSKTFQQGMKNRGDRAMKIAETMVDTRPNQNQAITDWAFSM